MKRNKIKDSRVKDFMVLLMIMLLASILYSCSSVNPTVKPQGKKEKIISDDTVRLKLEFIPEEELVRKFGKENNPFVSPVSFLKSNRLMIFKLEIMNKGYSDLVISLNKIELQYGGINARPYNRFQLANFWGPRVERQSEYEKWNKSILKTVINKNVFDNHNVIQKGINTEGYLVFKGPFPDYGRAVIFIPIFDESARMLKRYEVDFEL